MHCKTRQKTRLRFLKEGSSNTHNKIRCKFVPNTNTAVLTRITMFRLKNKKNRSSNKTTTANTTGTSAFNPASATPSSDDKMSAVRLPFLVVNSEMPSPTNFKGTRIPSTPATVHSMTPIASTGNSPKSAYVDLDSSVDSDEDGACIPSQIDAEVQALLSPLDQGLFNNEEKGNGRNNCFQENSDDDDDDDDEQTVISTASDYLAQGTPINSRIGISRPAYTSSYAGTDITPILNSRTMEQYSNANANSQFREDHLYQQKIQNGNGTGNGNGCTSTPGNQCESSHSAGHLGISSFPTTSASPYSNMDGDVRGTIININDDNSVTSGLGYVLDNERFITPGQAFVKKERSLPRRYTPEKGEGLGITPPPKNRSSRVLVPHVTPPSSDTYTVFILVIQPTAKMFELIRVNYRPATATIGDLVNLIPENVTEEDLRHQKHIGICRPHGSSSASRSLTDFDMTASIMTRDGTCARILCGEVLVGIPEGYTGKEAQILSQHILKLPKMKKLLQRSDPLSASKSGTGKSRRSSRSPISPLGIQPMNKQHTEIGTFSSSILFAPLSAAIHEDVDENVKDLKQFTDGIQIPRRDMIGPRRSTSNYSAARDDDDYSIGSSIASNLSRNGQAAEYASTIDAKVKLSQKMLSKKSIGLTAEQIEEIKREATLAARIAAEEAYAMRMEELIEDLNVSTDQKARIIHDPHDDLSFHSAFASVFSPPGKALPSDIVIGDITSPESAITGASSPCSFGATPRKHYRSLEDIFQRASPVPADAEEVLTSGAEVAMDVDEMELVASAMAGFFSTALDAVDEFLEKKESKIYGKDAKRKMALKAMACVSALFLSTHATNLDEEEVEDAAALASVADEPFTASDLQQVLLIFMVLVQGQNIVNKHKSKRKGRTLKSRVKVIA